MATLQARLTDLATRIAAEDQAQNDKINGGAADLAALQTTNKTNLVAAINEVLVAVAASSSIDDATTATATTWSSQKIQDELTALLTQILDGAPAALDTLAELATAVTGNDTDLSNILVALGNRVRFDQAQTLTAAQQVFARANIGAFGAPEIGDPDTNLVNIYEAGL